jgi:hypothetical protein
MELSDDFEPIVLLADQENFTGLAECRLVLLTQRKPRRLPTATTSEP